MIFRTSGAETVEQVRAAIQEMGYKPPLVKRGPKQGARRVVPVMFQARADRDSYFGRIPAVAGHCR
jgi:DNA-binding LacI/PurR family transcriptional regulator